MTRILDRMLLRGVIGVVAALALAAPALGADDPRQDEQWGLAMVEAPAAWPTSTGVGAVVAVIDSGVQSDHPDLAGRLRQGWDFVGDDPFEPGDEDADPSDGNGHGTHVSGVIVAEAGNGRGIAGVAPGARVLPLRVLDDDGGGYADDTRKAVDHAIAAGADVINLSLGDAIPLQSALFGDPAFEAALKRALAAGIVVAIAGGNNGLPLCENPDVEGILCVGSVDNRGTRSGFSSFGPNIDLMAPGGSALGGSSEDILSTVPPSTYESYAGTSQATPHVAGVAALLVSLGVRGADAANRILATATDAGAPGRDNQYGAGIVNARAAVAGLGVPPADPDDPPGPGDPPAAPGDPSGTPQSSFSTRRAIRAARVRRRGIKVVCEAARPGICALHVVFRGKRIARGKAEVAASKPTRVRARLNKRGRRLLARLKRSERKGIRVKVRVRLPGERVRAREIIIRR